MRITDERLKELRERGLYARSVNPMADIKAALDELIERRAAPTNLTDIGMLLWPEIGKPFSVRMEPEASIGENEALPQASSDDIRGIVKMVTIMLRRDNTPSRKEAANLLESAFVRALAAPGAEATAPATRHEEDVTHQAFEAWWLRYGQFYRAGGGDYEKTFAFHAWRASLAIPEMSQPEAPAVPPLLTDEQIDRALQMMLVAPYLCPGTPEHRNARRIEAIVRKQFIGETT